MRGTGGQDIPAVRPFRARYGSIMESEESTEVEAADSRVSLKIDPETARLLRQLCGASLDSRSQPGEVAWLVRRRAVELGIPVPPPAFRGGIAATVATEEAMAERLAGCGAAGVAG